MGKIIVVIPILCFFASCSTFNPYVPVKPDREKQTRKYEQKAKPPPEPAKARAKVPPVPAKEAPVEPKNVFNASFTDVWFATLEGLEWMKWAPAFIDEKSGEIVLKEAYVYKKSGNIMRTFTWPIGEVREFPDIDDYLTRVASYKTSPDANRPVFSQETMRIKVTRLSNTKTRLDIDYTVRPYFDSANFAEVLKSSNYIEKLLLGKIKDKLEGSYIDTTYLEN